MRNKPIHMTLAWQDRVVRELHDLQIKLMRLRDFRFTTTYRDLVLSERTLLDQQLLTMEQYERILLARIKGWRER